MEVIHPKPLKSVINDAKILPPNPVNKNNANVLNGP